MAASEEVPLDTAPADPRWHPLTGGSAVWIFMFVEVLTFGLFLLAHAWAWSGREAVFAEAQRSLHAESALLGTVILLVGSGFAYQAVLAMADARSRVAGGWLGASALTGVAFTVNKVVEYSSGELAGVTLSTNEFWFSYLFITGLHLAHVIGGVVILVGLAARVGRGTAGPEARLHVEAAAAYWHLVDVTWLLVFPILYLMHP